jgi:hypothetical protein
MGNTPAPSAVARWATSIGFRWSQGGYWISDQYGAVAPDVMDLFHRQMLAARIDELKLAGKNTQFKDPDYAIYRIKALQAQQQGEK